ncbi:DUF6207 family protein [Streptomyces naganishii]
MVRDTGQPGVRLRRYTDLRQVLDVESLSAGPVVAARPVIIPE